MSKNPLVSIITPVYNSEAFLKQTIESVLIQTYTNWELILIDDCSTDCSVSIINNYSKKNNRVVLLTNNTNCGPAATRNVGINHSSGEFVAFLDSDDWWLPNKLENQIGFMLAKNINFSYTSCVLHKEINKKQVIYKAPKSIDHLRILHSNPLYSPTVIYCQTAEKIKIPLVENAIEDWVHWINILQRYKIGYLLDEPLSCYRVRDDSISAKKTIMISKVWRFYSKTFSPHKRFFYFAMYIINNLKKHLFLTLKLN